MKQLSCSDVGQWLRGLIRSFLGAVTFYATIKLPEEWELEFQHIARWAPLVGLLLGSLLGLFDWGLSLVGIPILTRSALVVALWVALTGGLHLDGAMDSADGLAVLDPQRRLEVMKDSLVGAFGAMVAVVVLLLKTAALSDLQSYRWLGLMIATGWSRWGQVVAIALYPALKSTGGGAFHKQAIRPTQDILLGWLCLCGFSALQLLLPHITSSTVLLVAVASCGLALLPGFWFYRQLGGHTGDTYGAVVEWTEALILCLLTKFY